MARPPLAHPPQTQRLNALDRAIAYVAPRTALQRMHARVALAYYEAAKPNRQRRQREAPGSANLSVRAAGYHLRDQARHLEQNNIQARALLRTLANNTVGAHGIGIEPQPKRPDGSIHEPLATALAESFARWSKRPEVTGDMDRGECERMLARSAFRDGEVLCKLITGTGPTMPHRTGTPFSLQLLEADYLPLGFDSVYRVPDPTGERTYPINDGIELNAWGARRAYWLYDEHPGELGVSTTPALLTGAPPRRTPAGSILHLAMRDRLHQRRGVSLFASVLKTLDDLDEYEDAERTAAKVAASLAAAIVKGSPDLYAASTGGPAINDDDGTEPVRELKFRPGMIFDDLRPGESVEMIGNNGRPNPGMIDFRFAMLRGIAAATGCSFSSISKRYEGSYSAQRQELVESWIDYAVLSSWLISVFVRPVWERFVDSEVLAGNLRLPADLALPSLSDALFIPPSMPWIDPVKEANAWEKLEQAGHASGPEIIRRRGANPAAVMRTEIAWRQAWRSHGEQITADPASVDITEVPPGAPQEEDV